MNEQFKRLGEALNGVRSTSLISKQPLEDILWEPSIVEMLALELQDPVPGWFINCVALGSYLISQNFFLFNREKEDCKGMGIMALLWRVNETM